MGVGGVVAVVGGRCTYSGREWEGGIGGVWQGICTGWEGTCIVLEGTLLGWRVCVLGRKVSELRLRVPVLWVGLTWQ